MSREIEGIRAPQIHFRSQEIKQNCERNDHLFKLLSGAVSEQTGGSWSTLPLTVAMKASEM